VQALVAHRFLFVKNAVLCKRKMCSSSRIGDAQSCIELVDLLVAFQAKFRLLAAGAADGINGRQNLRGSFRIHTSDRAREVGRVEIHRVTWTRDQIWRGASLGTVEPSRCETKTESQGFHAVWNHAL
jgi:hypothetical protein